LQYKVAHHPNFIRAMAAYAQELKKRGLDEQLQEAKLKFGGLIQ